jgi:hypothetical protein
MDLNILYNALKASWNADTAYKNKWDPACPAMNQCCVTALVVQDYYGGDILSCPTKGLGDHFWNKIFGGEELDLTFSQFSFTKDIPYRDLVNIRRRKELLRGESVDKRYHLLKEQVEAHIK